MVNGITFSEQLRTSADDAHMFWKLFGKKSGITKGCAVSYSGNNLYVAAGYMLSHGRLTKITGTETIAAPTVSSGTLFCRLVYRINLDLVNTESVFNQGFFTVLQSSSAYPSLTQQDLDSGGTIYDLPFAKFKVTSSGIGSWVDESITFDDVTQISVPTSGWSGSGPYTKTFSVSSITANDRPAQGIVYPDSCTETQRKNIQESAARIIKIETGSGTVTLTASRVPTTAFALGLFM